MNDSMKKLIEGFKKETPEITLNNDQQLFVINHGKYTTCLGFQVCNDRVEKLCKELDVPKPSDSIGSIAQYNCYQLLVGMAQRKHEQTGWRSNSELNPKLIGLEGKRIECEMYGEKVRFYVGKSTGFIPCHLEIKRSNSSGGMAVSSNPDDLKNIRVIA